VWIFLRIVFVFVILVYSVGNDEGFVCEEEAGCGSSFAKVVGVGGVVFV